MQKQVRTLNHVYSGTMGPLPPPHPRPATPSPALLRQKFARASALNPNPPESLLGRGGAFTSICFFPCPPLQQNSRAGGFGFFFPPFSFLEAVVGAGNRGSLHPNIPAQGKQL